MSRKDDQLPDGGKVIDSEMAWFQFESECKLTGIQPGAFTAFTAGYDAGKADGIPQGTLDGYDAGYEAGEKERDDLRAENERLKADIAKAVEGRWVDWVE